MQFYEGKIIFENCAEDFFELNEKIADEKFLPIIFSETVNQFKFLILADFLERIDKKQVEKIFEKFCTVKEIFLREITPSQAKKFLLKAERENFISSYLAHVQNNLRGQENFSLDYLDNPNLKIEEILLDFEPLNFSAAIKNFAVDKNFLEELKRIYSPNHPKKFFGHPVHYKISAKNLYGAKEIAKILCRALYENNRLVGGCVNFIYDVKFAEIDVENIFRQSKGATVIIELKNLDEFFCELVKKFCDEVLFIFVGEKNFGGDLKIIELKENFLNREESFIFLKNLLTEKILSYNDAEIFDALGEKNFFCPSDIYEIFEKLREEHLSRKIYVDYKNFPRVEENFNAYKTLQNLIGLTEIKKILAQIIDNFKIQKLREEFGLKNFRQNMHMVFIGNPGTAKTTVARLFAQILNVKNFVECSRADLVGKYVGWTAPNVEKIFQKARGGILFIDEAYSLLDENFGNEAINEIVRQMELRRKNTIVIFAGYPEPMKNFLESNAGLKSRISFVINFPDYNIDELLKILKFMTREKNLKISAEVEKKCRKIFAEVYRKKNFGNGRFVRNLLEQAIFNQSQRILRENKKISRDELLTLKAEDFDEKIFVWDEDKKIGFIT